MEKRTVLLTTQNHKTVKGEVLGYKTYILYMSPYTFNSKGINVCSHASVGCSSACLVGSGMGGMYETVKQARLKKTEWFLSDRVGFINRLVHEIGVAVKFNADKYKVAIRLNGTSDIRWEKFKVGDSGKNIFELFPGVQFYDYTKNYKRYDSPLPPNYHLTFSRSEVNHDKCMELLDRGVNVAMVFKNTPTEYMGYKVIDGDKDDIRFIGDKGVIVGLRYKNNTGKGADNKIAYTTGFAIAA